MIHDNEYIDDLILKEDAEVGSDGDYTEYYAYCMRDYAQHMLERSGGLSYVYVTTPKMTHCINLFMGDHCIALVDNAQTANKLKAILPEKMS